MFFEQIPAAHGYCSEIAVILKIVQKMGGISKVWSGNESWSLKTVTILQTPRAPKGRSNLIHYKEGNDNDNGK